jgi:hypothetical protein
MLAFLQHDGRVAAHAVGKGTFRIQTKRLSGGVQRLWVGTHGFLASCGSNGQSWVLVQWPSGKLECHTETRHFVPNLPLEGSMNRNICDFVCGELSEAVRPLQSSDPNEDRWQAGTSNGRALYLLDHFGQVAVFSDCVKEGRILVFQFFAGSEGWTAWLPDGTRLGTGSVHRWPNSPAAGRTMGQALLALTGGSA